MYGSQRDISGKMQRMTVINIIKATKGAAPAKISFKSTASPIAAFIT